MSARALVLACLLAALYGCSSQPLRELLGSGKGPQALATGLREYDDGKYADASRNLQAAIDLGLSDADRTKAYKYLGFIDCSSGRERACRESFRKALAIDPALELAPAEAGHPVWGPVFRSLKASGSPFRLALRQYDEGNYAESAKTFQEAIKAGLTDVELASAHKHLAFMHCAQNRERQCRDEFRKALAADPSLELEPAEAGHPVWGPVFRAVKAQR